MTQFLYYKDPFGASGVFAVGLGNDVVRLGEVPGWVEMAEHCQTGSSSVTFDDPDADIGYAGDAIRGNARLEINETACSTQRLYTGIFGVRNYRRRPGSSLILGSSREVECEIHDLNALLSFRIIPQSDSAANRPAETVEDRLAWIVGSTYLSTVHDNGLIVANSTMMTKADYRGQRPVNVINDCEMAAGFGWNAFVYYDEPANQPSLFFDNANTSTAWSSTLRISNYFSDADAFTDPAAITFLPSIDAELRRDPTELASGVFLPYKRGAVYRTSALTTETYGRKDISAPNSNVSKASRAQDQADDILFQHSTEEDRITVSVELPPSHVNLIRAGHRIQVRFQHLPGYEAWTWMRVLMRAPAQTRETDDRYTVRLELSPQEIPCSESETPTFVQFAYHDQTLVTEEPQYTETWSYDDPTAIGNLLVVGVLSPLDTNASVVNAPGWNWALVNEPNEDSGGSYCNVFWKVSQGDQDIKVQFLDTDGNRRVVMAEYHGLNNPQLATGPITNLQDPGVGNATVSSTAYPAGPALVMGLCFMTDGPTGTDDLSVTPGDVTLRNAIDGGLHGNNEIGLADKSYNGSAGTSGWVFQLTGGGPTLTVGLAFEGGSCL